MLSLSVTVTVVARVAVPVTAPTRGPAKPVAVRIPSPAWYVRPASVLAASEPVAESNIAIEELSSVESTTTTVLARVEVSALPSRAPMNATEVSLLVVAL